MRSLISLLILFSTACGSNTVYDKPPPVIQKHVDTVYTPNPLNHKLQKDNHLLRVEIDHLKKKIKLLKIRKELDEL